MFENSRRLPCRIYLILCHFEILLRDSLSNILKFLNGEFCFKSGVHSNSKFKQKEKMWPILNDN